MRSVNGFQTDVEISRVFEQHPCAPAGGDIKGTPAREMTF